MSEWWDCRSREDVLPTLDWLIQEGHRTPYREAVDAVRAGISPRDEWESRVFDLAARLATTHEDILAWDLCRAVFVVRNAHGAGWLSQKEAEDRLLAIGRDLQRHHHSWRDVVERYCAGREFWSVFSRTDAGDVRGIANRLLKSKRSPFNTVEWKRDLG